MLRTYLGRGLRQVPPALSSTPHILFLMFLGCWLVVLPELGILHPSANAELIGGNYLNVACGLGACISAGASVGGARRHAELRNLLMRMGIRQQWHTTQIGRLIEATASDVLTADLQAQAEKPVPPANTP
ncbi:MAG: hypothetical protein HOY79_49700 [Streptomyces sp.]|nr:hypothetical protein [Streptomyces sp.]